VDRTEDVESEADDTNVFQMNFLADKRTWFGKPTSRFVNAREVI
jgi:hypothetical protein